MNLDKRVLGICQESAMRHIKDIEKAVQEVKRRLKVPPLDPWIAVLVDNALREQVHLARAVSNRKLRKAAGAYGGPGKVGASEALDALANEVWQSSVLNHTICGWTLGDIPKADLMSFAAVEDERAAGSIFNAELCRECYQACAKKKGETVRECLTERQVQAMFRKIAKKMGRDAA